MKQIYVSDEVAQMIKMFPKGMRIQVVDMILKDFLEKILNNATIKDLNPENFEDFYKKLIVKIAFEIEREMDIDFNLKEVRNNGSKPDPKKHIKTKIF